jgi:hypothetical protein
MTESCSCSARAIAWMVSAKLSSTWFEHRNIAPESLMALSSMIVFESLI